MPKFPSLKPSEIIRFLIRNGFIIDRVKGSHHIMYNGETKRWVIVHFTGQIYPSAHFAR